MTQKPYNILVLCTGNSARSIMAEALIAVMGKGRFHAYSAGSHPTGTVNPYALEQIAAIGYPPGRLHSKSWEEFARPDAPQMDFIITVCDNAASELCPVWPGQPIAAHWGFEDPALCTGNDAEKRAVFAGIFQHIKRRVEMFVALPFHSLDKAAIIRQLRAIGGTPR